MGVWGCLHGLTVTRLTRPLVYHSHLTSVNFSYLTKTRVRKKSWSQFYTKRSQHESPVSGIMRPLVDHIRHALASTNHEQTEFRDFYFLSYLHDFFLPRGLTLKYSPLVNRMIFLWLDHHHSLMKHDISSILHVHIHVPYAKLSTTWYSEPLSKLAKVYYVMLYVPVCDIFCCTSMSQYTPKGIFRHCMPCQLWQLP